MTSWPDSPEPVEARRSPAPLAAEGGVRSIVEPSADWIVALDDLMAVVEAFCPGWPERRVFGPMHDLRL